MGLPPTTTESTAPATAEPPPAGLPDPTPPSDASASDNGVAAPASPPQGEQGEGQGQTPPEPDTSPPPEHPWTGAEDVDAVLATEPVATRLEAMKTEHLEEGRRTAQSQLQPTIQANQQRLEGVLKGTQDMLRSWNKSVKAGELTPEQATDIIEEHRPTFEALAQMQLESGRWEGRGEWINLAGKVDATIPAEFNPRFQALQQGLDDPTFTDDFMKAIGKAVADPIRAELKEARAEVEQLKATATASGRTASPAPAKTSGVGGGGGGLNRAQVIKMDQGQISEMSVEELDSAMSKT